MSKIWQRLSLSIISIICTLIFVEIIFRLVVPLKQRYALSSFVVSDPFVVPDNYCWQVSNLLGHEKIPNCRPGINSYGFVGNNFSLKKPENTFRILIIGDSIAEGNYFIEYLRKKFRPLLLRRNIEFINAGMGGYNIWHYYRFLKYKGIKFDPDMILFSFCLDDFTAERGLFLKTEIGLTEVEMPSRIFYILPLNINLFWHSYLYRFLIASIQGLKQYGVDYYEEAEGVRYIRRIKEICQNHNIQFSGFIWPYLMPINKYGEFRSFQYATMLKVLTDLKFNYIDLHKYFPKDNSIKSLRVTKDDYVHPNKEGYIIGAEAIFQHLMKDGIL